MTKYKKAQATIEVEEVDTYASGRRKFRVTYPDGNDRYVGIDDLNAISYPVPDPPDPEPAPARTELIQWTHDGSDQRLSAAVLIVAGMVRNGDKVCIPVAGVEVWHEVSAVSEVRHEISTVSLSHRFVTYSANQIEFSKALDAPMLVRTGTVTP